jgi:hypothetical protein
MKSGRFYEPRAVGDDFLHPFLLDNDPSRLGQKTRAEALVKTLGVFSGLRGVRVYTDRIDIETEPSPIPDSEVISALAQVGQRATPITTGTEPHGEPIFRRTAQRASPGATRGSNFIQPTERMPFDHVLQSTDVQSARVEFRSKLSAEVERGAGRPVVNFVRAQEGIGKSTAALALLDPLSRARTPLMSITDRGNISARPSFFLSSSYEGAWEKFEQYRDHGDGRFFPVFLPSLSRVYEQTCAALGRQPITVREAAEAGFKSRLEAVRNDAEVWARMRITQNAAWVRHPGLMFARSSLIFTVHATAYTGSLATAWWYTPDFFDAVEDINIFRQRPPAALNVIHDEVSTDTLVRMDEGNLVDLAMNKLFLDDPELWDEGKLDSKFKHWESRNQWTPGLSFERALEIYSRGYTEADYIRLKADAEEHYGRIGGSSYRSAEAFYAKPHRWWDRFGDATIIMLTTEYVPTAIARTISDVNVIDIGGRVGGGTLTVRPKRMYTGDIPKEIAELRRELGAITIISNKAKQFDDTVTHARVRGSNSMIGRTLGQIIPPMRGRSGRSASRGEQRVRHPECRRPHPPRRDAAERRPQSWSALGW